MGLKSIPALPAIYRMFRKVVADEASRRAYIRDYLRSRPGDRMLDIGCGPGDPLEHLPDVAYVGIDLSPRYIEAAQGRFGSRGRFVCKPVEEMVLEEPASFDIVMANGVVHHLDDSSALVLYAQARRALKPTGRFVSFDGAFVEGQSPLARLFLRNDRGKFVRAPETYAALASQVFPDVKVSVRHDLLRIPYTHALLACSNDPNPRRQDVADEPAAIVNPGATGADDRASGCAPSLYS
jgi:SAM-dependent methyltransferase